MRVWFAVVLVACGASTQPVAHPATTGAIAGIARDHDSGDPIEQAIVHVGDREVTSNAQGAYQLAGIAPGTYQVSASFAGQPLTVDHVVVSAGKSTVVDLTFTLGRPAPIHDDFSALTAIDHYTPKHLAKGTAIIEGTVNDSGSHERIAGAVVTAVGPGVGELVPTLQTISDEQGRYRFDGVPPGLYIVSTYYSVGGHGQIEVRRSDVDVIAGQAVVVPLWMETQH